METELEKRFVKFIGIKTLPHHIFNLAKNDEIEPICIQRARRAIFIEKMKNKYNLMALNNLSEFEIYVVVCLILAKSIEKNIC